MPIQASEDVSFDHGPREQPGPGANARRLTLSTLPPTSVLIASNLRKEFAGDPLFEGVSFAVGRRDRLSLAVPNGAGKTTLLRAIAGETSLQGGDLGDAVLAALADSDEPPRVVKLAVQVMPGSGKPNELLAEAGIDAEHIAEAARRVVAVPSVRLSS